MSRPAALLLDNAILVPMDGPLDAPLGHVRPGRLRVRDGRIEAIGELEPEPGEEVLDAGGCHLLPGFVQGHVHFCQTLFRGLADNLPLIDWLHKRIWPLEGAHDANSAQVSAELSLLELWRGGTTTAQVMESVHHAEQAMALVRDSGMQCVIGNCLMDQPGEDVPTALAPSTAEALQTMEALHGEFHQPDGPLRYAVSPRFVLSCSEELSRAAAAFATEHRLHIHTHACEHPFEGELVRGRFGQDAIPVLDAQGLLGPRSSLAHCVHTSAEDRARLQDSGTTVLHCPSTNLKLGSGIAPLCDYLQREVPVALGADGAACNNRLDALTEARQAALLQDLVAGPNALAAARVLHLLTMGGAQALGLEAECGSLSPGKRADLLVCDLRDPLLGQSPQIANRLIYAADRSHIRDVLVAGQLRVHDGQPVGLDPAELAGRAEQALAGCLSRAGLSR